MLDELLKILSKVSPNINISQITKETRLVEDLDFDSLAMIMMSMEIEESFGFKFKEFVRFETVGDVSDYLECRI